MFAGFGVAPKRTFLFSSKRKNEWGVKESSRPRVRHGQAAAATALRNSQRELVELVHPFSLTDPDVTRF